MSVRLRVRGVDSYMDNAECRDCDDKFGRIAQLEAELTALKADPRLQRCIHGFHRHSECGFGMETEAKP